jgi:GNAT superfamily N-acetyltransferase
MKILPLVTKQQIASCFPVMRQLRPHLDATAFAAAVGRIKKQGYRLVAIMDPDVRAVAGYRFWEMLAMGTVLYVDDLVTAPEHRSKGYGGRLLKWLLDEAKRQNCAYLELDSGVKRLDAHRFYERNGLQKAAFHFSIPAKAKAPWFAHLKV